MAETAGLTTVTLHDISNASHELTIAEAKQVALAIGLDYQTKLAAKQARMRDVDAVDLGAADAIERIEAV